MILQINMRLGIESRFPRFSLIPSPQTTSSLKMKVSNKLGFGKIIRIISGIVTLGSDFRFLFYFAAIRIK